MHALPRLVCATANPHKVAEIADILAGVVELLPRPIDVPDVVEDAGTLEGNARLKAAAVCAATGMAAVSDDTGLFVAALDDAPGVDTAYYAGPDATYAQNRSKLLAALEGKQDRSASFRTVVMVVWPDGSELVVTGVCNGTIASAELGTRGFGYDPIFIPHDGDGRSFSEMLDTEKNAISHRGRAFTALITALRER
ncbi:MAG: RdgB/HAM1 family non-canonical purine NTP pyrophosphatase [Ilumatobacteraceae bacterium]